MADALERLLTDHALARTLGDAARDQARREFSWDQVAARVEEVYRKAIAEAALVAQQLLDRPAREVGRLRRAEPLEHGRHEVGGIVGAGARSRRNPGSPGDEPAMGRVVARAAGGQLPALGPADLTELVGDQPLDCPHRAAAGPTARPDREGSGGAARWGRPARRP